MRRRVVLLSALGIALLGYVAPAPAENVSATWNTYRGPWSDPANWSSNPLYPNNTADTSFDVIINSDYPWVDQDITIDTLTMTGGRLDNMAHTLTINRLFTWTGGEFSGSGRIIAKGGIVLNGPQMFLQSNSENVIENRATAVWKSGGLSFPMENLVNAVFDIQCDSGYASLGLINHGTITRSSGTGLIRLDGRLENHGTFDLVSGTAQLRNGTTNYGVIQVQAGATLEFTTDGSEFANMAAGSQLRGAGTVRGTLDVSGTYDISGTTHLNGGILRFLPGSTIANLGTFILENRGTVEFSHGAPIVWDNYTLNDSSIAGSDPLIINGVLDLQHGFLTGATPENAGPVIINGRMTGNGFLEMRTLENRGQIEVSGLSLNRATINNMPGATFTIGDGIISASNDSTFNNQGTLRRIATAGKTTIGVALNSSGTLEVPSGTLELWEGGQFTGRVSIGPEATLVLNKTSVFEPRSVLEGSGTVQFGVVTFPAESYHLTGPVLVSGVLSVAGDLTMRNVTWRGALAGAGKTTIPVDGNWSVNSTSTLDGRMLDNFSTLTFAGSQLTLKNGAVFNNMPGAVVQFTLPAGGTPRLTNGGGAASIFHNMGTLVCQIKSAATLDVTAPMHNAGAIEARGGTLQFIQYTQTDGVLRLAGGSVSFQDPTTIEGGLLTGSGSVTIRRSLTNKATIAPGAPLGTLTFGHSVLATDMSLADTSQLLIDIGGRTQGTAYDFVQVNANLTLGGDLVVSFFGEFESQITPADTFTILTTKRTLTGAFDNVASGQRLFTTDGLGSFLVSYSAGTRSVVLSDFQAVPEPAGILWAVLSAGLLARVRRR